MDMRSIKLMKVLTVVLVSSTLVSAALAGHFFIRNRSAQERMETLANEKTELTAHVQSLEERVTNLSRQLADSAAKSSKEKDAEIQRLSSAQEQLVSELKEEIGKKEIEITSLADRLSVSLVDKILFPSGEAEISPAGLRVLQRVGNIIKNVEDKTVRVEGHTDNVSIRPSLQKQFPTNWELSTARATNVVRFLQDKVGMDPTRLQAVGFSEYHPLVSNDKPAGRSKNRRIEITLLPMTSAPKLQARLNR
jgi:chemotaxis protein MotB